MKLDSQNPGTNEYSKTNNVEIESQEKLIEIAILQLNTYLTTRVH